MVTLTQPMNYNHSSRIYLEIKILFLFHFFAEIRSFSWGEEDSAADIAGSSF